MMFITHFVKVHLINVTLKSQNKSAEQVLLMDVKTMKIHVAMVLPLHLFSDARITVRLLNNVW